MIRQVDLARRARQDAEDIYAWIADRSREGADRWYAAFLKALESLATSAEGRGLAPESEELDVDVRQAFFKTRRGRTYRALFTIDGTRVHVLAVRGSGQRLLTPDELSEGLS